MFESVKAVAISIKPKKWDKIYNADKLERLFEEAARQNPQLMLAPEGVLEGYVVMDVIEGRRTAEEMLDIAESVDGPYIARFQRLARALKICLCFGFAERIGDEVFNSAIFIDGDGEICGKYHKVQLAEGTHDSWYFNRIGFSLRAFDTPIGRVGIVICNDRWNPMIARTLVLDGAQLLLIPSYGLKQRSQNQTVLARARENGVPIVEANVGMNLIISKGEIMAYKWGNDQITAATIDVPVHPSMEAARLYEHRFLIQQKKEMELRFLETGKRLDGEKNLVKIALEGGLIAEKQVSTR